MRVVSLGDSFSCGAGVGLRLPLADTWVGRLTAALSGADHVPLATAGARTADVRHAQLPAALAAAPDLATLATGLNDVTRAGFDGAVTRADLLHVVAALRGTGARVLLVRLHDPTTVLPLPGSLRRAVQARMVQVNAAVEEAARMPGVVLVDLGAVGALRLRGAWAVDRMHPSAAGHAAIAWSAARALRQSGQRVQPVRRVTAGELPADPGLVAETAWLLRHGLPWLASHGRQVGAPLLSMAARGLPAQTVAEPVPLAS